MSPRRVALVTGAARGIGAATVRRLSRDGYAVLALDAALGHDRGIAEAGYPMPEPADLEAVAAGLPDVLAHRADVRDRGEMRAAVDVAVERWGRLDVVVTGAAVVGGGRPLWEDDSLGRLWETDVAGVWHTLAACVPAMLAGPDPSGCRIVAIASTAGSRGLFHLAAYTAVKHAVIGIVRGLAADLVGTGVSAVAVSPGATDTPMLRATAELYGLGPDDLAAHQTQGLLAPDDIAEVVAWCASPQGRVLSGSVVDAGGGFAG